jgi:triosephosphate isomerase
MNLGIADDARALVRRLRPSLTRLDAVEVAICPPFTVLGPLSEVLAASPIALGAQNVHPEAAGAHTGEISPPMLSGLCEYVIVGHSERRAAGETDDEVNRKVRACLDHDLAPILCVGENAAQHAAGETDTVVRAQLASALTGLSADQVTRCVLAYEPIWAIGSGSPATPAAANLTMGLGLRGCLEEMFGTAAAEGIRLLYGGSVGALVGGASLGPEFAELVKNAAV